jgi:Arc/MetJ-type ribon-helix-helix transcriptional regulator
MKIELKPEHERTIELAIQSGAYQNRDEVLDQAFEILREQLHYEDWMGEQRQALACQIATGFAQAEQGQLLDGEEAVRILRQRRAERLKTEG